MTFFLSIFLICSGYRQAVLGGEDARQPGRVFLDYVEVSARHRRASAGPACWRPDAISAFAQGEIGLLEVAGPVRHEQLRAQVGLASAAQAIPDRLRGGATRDDRVSRRGLPSSLGAGVVVYGSMALQRVEAANRQDSSTSSVHRAPDVADVGRLLGMASRTRAAPASAPACASRSVVSRRASTSRSMRSLRELGVQVPAYNGRRGHSGRAPGAGLVAHCRSTPCVTRPTRAWSGCAWSAPALVEASTTCRHRALLAGLVAAASSVARRRPPRRRAGARTARILRALGMHGPQALTLRPRHRRAGERRSARCGWRSPRLCPASTCRRGGSAAFVAGGVDPRRDGARR